MRPRKFPWGRILNRRIRRFDIRFQLAKQIRGELVVRHNVVAWRNVVVRRLSGVVRRFSGAVSASVTISVGPLELTFAARNK
jgi:hypothetical protein